MRASVCATSFFSASHTVTALRTLLCCSGSQVIKLISSLLFLAKKRNQSPVVFCGRMLEDDTCNFGYHVIDWQVRGSTGGREARNQKEGCFSDVVADGGGTSY